MPLVHQPRAFFFGWQHEKTSSILHPMPSRNHSICSSTRWKRPLKGQLETWWRSVVLHDTSTHPSSGSTLLNGIADSLWVTQLILLWWCCGVGLNRHFVNSLIVDGDNLRNDQFISSFKPHHNEKTSRLLDSLPSPDHSLRTSSRWHVTWWIDALLSESFQRRKHLCVGAGLCLSTRENH